MPESQGLIFTTNSVEVWFKVSSKILLTLLLYQALCRVTTQGLMSIKHIAIFLTLQFKTAILLF